MFIPGKLQGRNEFPRFLNGLGLVNRAVEVGTHRGDFAFHFLTQWNGRELVCVDHWQPDYDPNDPAARGDREEDRQACVRRLIRFGDRATIMQRSSAEAARTFSNGSLDFVYVDADHRKSAVFADLTRWYPKLRPGGVLAGHDVLMPNEPESHGGHVQFALYEFLRNLYGRPGAFYKSRVHLVPEGDGTPWSYYLFRE